MTTTVNSVSRISIDAFNPRLPKPSKCRVTSVPLLIKREIKRPLWSNMSKAGKCIYGTLPNDEPAIRATPSLLTTKCHGCGAVLGFQVEYHSLISEEDQEVIVTQLNKGKLQTMPSNKKNYCLRNCMKQMNIFVPCYKNHLIGEVWSKVQGKEWFSYDVSHSYHSLDCPSQTYLPDFKGNER
ncbi:hypothetical protein ML8HA_02707 [Lactococcus lactis]|nr:hypothetical protein [Lactococcus lactis]